MSNSEIRVSDMNKGSASRPDIPNLKTIAFLSSILNSEIIKQVLIRLLESVNAKELIALSNSDGTFHQVTTE